MTTNDDDVPAGCDAWVDFNDTMDGEIYTTSTYCRATPRVGEWLKLGDGEGNTCMGKVNLIKPSPLTAGVDVIYLALDDATWVASD